MDLTDKILSQGCKQIITCFSDKERPAKMDSSLNSGHPHEEILFVISGESDYFFNDSICRLKPGTAVLIDSWRNHGFGYNSTDNDLTHCWCHHFNGKWATTIMKIGNQGKITVKEIFLQFPQELSMIIMNRWQKLFSRESADEETVNKYMLLPLNLLLNELMIARTEPQKDQPEVSELLKTFICNRNGRNCSLDKLASLVNLSRCHIAHIFHRETGITIGDFINSVRKKYIENANSHGLRRKEIAAELGFSSPGALSNWMRKHYKDS